MGSESEEDSSELSERGVFDELMKDCFTKMIVIIRHNGIFLKIYVYGRQISVKIISDTTLPLFLMLIRCHEVFRWYKGWSLVSIKPYSSADWQLGLVSAIGTYSADSLLWFNPGSCKEVLSHFVCYLMHAMDFMEFALQESKEFKIERTNIRYLGNARFGIFMVLLTFVARFSMMSLYLVNLP